MTNADFLTSMYQNVLLRTPDTAGMSYYQGRLDQGLATRAQVVETFLNSPEIQGAPTALAGVYQAVLGRQPDMSGLQFWAGIMNTGASLPQIAQQMATSAEFTQKYANLGSESALINQIYQNALGRAADPSGLAYWQSQLNTGSNIGSVATSIALSAEGKTHNNITMEKTLLWHAIIGNEPTAAQLSALPNATSALAVAMMQQQAATPIPSAFWENSGTIYGSVALTGNLNLDLNKNTLTMNGSAQSLIQGSLPAGINADFSALTLPVSTSKTTTSTTTPTQMINFTGDDAANTYVGSNYGDSIRSGKGNDTITLGSGTDLIYFADSSSNNGIDTINQFTLGTDLLNFTAFLNKTSTGVSMIAMNSAQSLQQRWQNGDVLVIQGNALTDAATIAALFGTTIANPTGASKAVLITADVTGDALIWYLTNQTDTTHITADEISQVGVLTGVNNLLDQHTLASLLASTQVNALASVTYDSTSFQESGSNDGSISNTINLNLAGDVFTGVLGASLGKVSNVPAGLVAKLIKTSDTTATLILTGKAIANTFADSISNLTVTFTSKDFMSANLAMNSVTDTISVNFIDLNINETNGTLSVVGIVPSNVIIDLTNNTVTSGSNTIALLSGSLLNANTIDLHALTLNTTTKTMPTITVNGSANKDIFIASPVGETLRGEGGIDGYLLGAGVDKIIFEATAANNGIDVVNGFKLGAGGDVLDFSSFLNVTGRTNIATKNAISTAAAAWNNGDVLVVQGDSINTAAKVAALFGVGSVFAAPTGQAKAVVISSDLVGDATVWYVTNQANATITTIEETEVAQVAILQGINNMILAGLAVGNLA
jgi:hypothetical protein